MYTGNLAENINLLNMNFGHSDGDPIFEGTLIEEITV